MPDLHANFAYSLVATAPSPAASGTSLVVTAGQGALFPTAPFNATIWPTAVQPLSTNAEIVRVTARTTDTLTITRTQEGSSARTIVVGDQIAATVTSLTLTDVEGTAAAAVPKALYDANTVLAADANDTPAAVTMGASTILARLAAGNIKAASVAEIKTLLALTGATKQLTIPLSVGDASGNAYPALVVGTNVRLLVPAFVKDVDGFWYGPLRVPKDYSSAGKIVVWVGSSGTSAQVSSMTVETVVRDTAAGWDAAAYTAETVQDITVSTTAYRPVAGTFTLTTTPAADKVLLVRIKHVGTAANDTLALDTLLLDCYFEYTT